MRGRRKGSIEVGEEKETGRETERDMKRERERERD